MDEYQRAFIVKVIELNPDWRKCDLMKALILFNKAVELQCGISDDKLNSFIEMIDQQNMSLNYWLRKKDEEFRAQFFN